MTDEQRQLMMSKLKWYRKFGTDELKLFVVDVMDELDALRLELAHKDKYWREQVAQECLDRDNALDALRQRCHELDEENDHLEAVCATYRYHIEAHGHDQECSMLPCECGLDSVLLMTSGQSLLDRMKRLEEALRPFAAYYGQRLNDIAPADLNHFLDLPIAYRGRYEGPRGRDLQAAHDALNQTEPTAKE